MLCEQAKTTIRNEETDRDEIQFDEPERAELASNISKEDDDVSFVIANVILM